MSILKYYYAPTGQRISKTVNGVTTNHIWDNNGNIVYEYGTKGKTAYNRGLGGEIIKSARGGGCDPTSVKLDGTQDTQLENVSNVNNTLTASAGDLQIGLPKSPEDFLGRGAIMPDKAKSAII